VTGTLGCPGRGRMHPSRGGTAVADADVVHDAYSPEWADAFKAEINNSSKYRQAAAGWEGTVVLVVLA
jgi:hypothetical protein